MDDEEVERACLTAFEAGYRHVDTAENYGNEVGVGRAVRASGIPREELFVTTKINARWHGAPADGLAGTLRRLGLEYVDLLLLHWPNPAQDLYVRGWEGLVELRERGLARSIGVSNFKPAHLDRVVAATGVTPELNQVELHPFLTRDRVRAVPRRAPDRHRGTEPSGGRRRTSTSSASTSPGPSSTRSTPSTPVRTTRSTRTPSATDRHPSVGR